MKKRKTVGYGWVGEWRNKELGWMVPTHIHKHDKRGSAAHPRIHPCIKADDKFVLCRITVEEVKDIRGRPIIRKGATIARG